MKKLEFETSKGRFLVNEEGKGISLKEIPEEQASEIVDFEDGDRMLYGYAKNKLHSLLKSKGIHLFKNPLKDSELSFIGNVSGIDMLLAKQKHDRRIKEAEAKTFYNPYIFKL